MFAPKYKWPGIGMPSHRNLPKDGELVEQIVDADPAKRAGHAIGYAK